MHRGLLSFFVFVTLAQTPAQAAPPPKAAASKPMPAPKAAVKIEDPLQEQFRKTLNDSRTVLGTLEPWQERIFKEEILPEPNRFIRDYRSAGGGVTSAEVEIETLKSYLKLHAKSHIGKPTEKIPFQLTLASDCKPCAAAEATLKPWIVDRLERRGFLLDEKSGEKVAEKVDFATASSSLKVSIQPSESDDEEGLHGDQKNLDVRIVFRLKGPPGQKDYVSDHLLQVSESDPLLVPLHKLWVQTSAELGDQVRLVTAAAEQSWIQLQGYKDYREWKSIKAALDEKLKGRSDCVVQELRRGSSLLAVTLSTEELKKAVQGLVVGGGKLVVVQEQADRLVMELK